MSRDPRATARACFTLAREGATEGERSAALNRGMAIIERYKLNPNDFAIPGRMAGKRADRIIVDDPYDIDGFPLEMRDFVSAAYRRAAMSIIADEVIADILRGAFGEQPARAPKPETATQKAERQREETMSEYVRRTGS